MHLGKQLHRPLSVTEFPFILLWLSMAAGRPGVTASLSWLFIVWSGVLGGDTCVGCDADVSMCWLLWGYM